MQIAKVKSGELHLPPNEGGYVITGSGVDHLVGRMLTLIETLGLKEGQEKAIKDLVRQEIWSPFNNLHTTYVDGELTGVIQRATYHVRQYYDKKSPQSTAVGVKTSKPTKIVYELTVSEE